MFENLPEDTHLVRTELGFELGMSFTYSDSTRTAKTKTDLVLEILFFKIKTLLSVCNLVTLDRPGIGTLINC